MKAEELPDLYTCDLIDTGETILRGEKIPEGRYILAAYISPDRLMAVLFD